ncbi:MAG: deoxyribose-phosphate aldolase [Planctomycetes bacterium]|nr:deoxyribose-phosphate aldolase [Planctomycetota bacterium]
MTESIFDPSRLAGLIDHTLLRSDASISDIERHCREGIEYGFCGVCIHPCHIRLACEVISSNAERSQGKALPRICSVVAFPFGATHVRVIRAEAEQAIMDGVEELDMPVNLAAALGRDRSTLTDHINALVEPAKRAGVVTKLILEAAALDVETKIYLCRLASDLGVDFVKTSTGFHPAGGATVEDVGLLYEHRGRCKVKAAGGIGDLETALAMIRAGAERLGTSRSVKIVEGLDGGGSI